MLYNPIIIGDSATCLIWTSPTRTRARDERGSLLVVFPKTKPRDFAIVREAL